MLRDSDNSKNHYKRVAEADGGDESGLGMFDEEDHEIDGSHFVQLGLPTSPVTTLKSITFGSVQAGEQAKIYVSNALGDLGTLFATITTDATVDVSGLPAGSFINISGGGAGGADILIDSLVVDLQVPDGGTTLVMLGGALTVVGIVRRKLVA
jgi:hypothetical protein